MQTVLQDIRFAIRTLSKAPVLTLVAVITIALGVGASTAVFSMVNGVMLRRLPYGAGARLVSLHQPTATQPDVGFSPTEVSDYRAQVPELSAVMEYHSMPFDLYNRGPEPLRVLTGVVSDNFFTALDVRPMMGRTFLPGEDAIGAPAVVVLSYRFWLEKLGGDPNVVGSTFTMNDRQHTIVGVLPPLPGYPDDNDIWMPAGACPFRSSPQTMNTRNARMVGMFALLRPGVTLDQANKGIALESTRLQAQYPGDYAATSRFTTTAVGLSEEITRRSRPLFYTLLATAAFVLLIAGANFANLTFARQLKRGREIALRTALGASRARLFRQLVTESLCITVTGGLLGVFFASAGLGMLRTLAARVTPRAAEISIDPVVLAFALLLSVAVGLVASLSALRRAGRSLAVALRAGAASTTGTTGDGRARNALVMVQVALAFVVLIAAGLLTRSVLALERVDGGYAVDHVMTGRLSLNFVRYNTGSRVEAFAEALKARLSGMPGVTAVAVTTDFPLASAQPSAAPFQIRGNISAPNDPGPTSDVTAASPGYFKTIGVPLLRGRDFNDSDRDTTNVPVIIAQHLAKTYWKSRDALGSQISLDGGAHRNSVIGIAPDVRQNGLSYASTDEIYVPFATLGSTRLNVLVVHGAIRP